MGTAVRAAVVRHLGLPALEVLALHLLPPGTFGQVWDRSAQSGVRSGAIKYRPFCSLEEARNVIPIGLD
jgi:hypothetical protein